MTLLPANDEEFTMETRDASPAHFLIRIESFPLLSKYGIKEYESREFVAGDYKWRLIIYPDGHKSEKEGNHVHGRSQDFRSVRSKFFFHFGRMNVGPICEKKIEEGGKYEGKMQRFHAMKSKWGFSKMISKKSLTDESNGFLVDDNCVFGAEVFVIKSQRVVECVSLLNVFPYKRDWKISGFSKLGNVWTSEEFTAGDHKWNIELYPDGDAREKGRSVSIFLNCVDSKSFAANEKVRADYCIQIKNSLHSTDDSAKPSHSKNYSNWFTSTSTGWGSPAFIPIAKMRDPCQGFIVDDCCFLEIEVSVQAVVRNAPTKSN